MQKVSEVSEDGVREDVVNRDATISSICIYSETSELKKLIIINVN